MSLVNEKTETSHGEKLPQEEVDASSPANTDAGSNLHREKTKEELQRERTLAEIDLENKGAYLGDDSDGKIEWTVMRLLAANFLSMLYTGSQVILYFVGGSLSFIADDLGGAAISGWLPTANTLAIAAVAPFVGYLDDLFGKRYITLGGSLAIVVGCILVGTAHSFGQAVGGMAIAGAGAGIGELTGLAGLAETVPVKHRGYAIAALTAYVFPFTPYVLYSELLSTRHTWRWGIWIALIYNAVTLVGLAFTYFPKEHTRATGMTTAHILKRIDFVGGFLSITGLTIFLVALQAGGYTHPWTSAYVLCTLIIGFFTLVAWVIWEWKITRYPMIPHGLFSGQKVVGYAFIVAFVAGMNFFSYLNFWPLTISRVYDPDPVKVGLRGLGAGLATTVGAIVANALLSRYTGGARWILFAFCTILTAFGGALSCLTPENEVTTVVLGTMSTLGLGGIIVPAATIAMIAAPDALITTCAALSLSVRAVGGSIGYSIYFNIFHKKLMDRLPTYAGTYAIQAGLPLTSAEMFVGMLLLKPENVVAVPGVTPAIIEAAQLGVRWAYADSLRYVWWASISFGACAMIAALMIPNTKKYQTNRVAVAL